MGLDTLDTQAGNACHHLTYLSHAYHPNPAPKQKGPELGLNARQRTAACPRLPKPSHWLRHRLVKA